MLAPVFPMNLIEQEVSQERWIDIPEDLLEKLCLWRPSPLYRAKEFEKRASDVPGRVETPEVIDPVLAYASYVGGGGDEAGAGIAVGPAYGYRSCRPACLVANRDVVDPALEQGAGHVTHTRLHDRSWRAALRWH